MSRTWKATGTGSFTRADEVRRDRSAIRQHNQKAENRLNQKAVPIHGATEANPEGTLTHEQAQQVIRNGDKITTPDGIQHIVRASNREELIGRLGATITRPAANDGRVKAGKNMVPRGRVERYTGNVSKPAKGSTINPKTGRVVPKDGGAKSGKATRVETPQQRNLNQVLPFGVLQGIGQGSNKLNKGTGIGFQKIGPTSTYKASPNSKNTAITGSKGNTKLNTRIAKVGGYAPKSSRSVVSTARTAGQRAREAKRASDKAAGIVKPVVKRGPRAQPPAGEIRSTGKPAKGQPRIRGFLGEIKGGRKGGRTGRGRSK
jgi:hypothetical protein